MQTRAALHVGLYLDSNDAESTDLQDLARWFHPRIARVSVLPAVARARSTGMRLVDAYEGQRRRSVGSAPAGERSNEPVASEAGLAIDLLVVWGKLDCDPIPMPPLGVLEVTLSDAYDAPNDAAGFWEVYHRDDATWFSIHWRDAAGRRLVFRESIQTRYRFGMNRSRLVARAVHHVQRQIIDLLEANEARATRTSESIEAISAGHPGIRHALGYAVRDLRRRAASLVWRLLGRDKRWSVSYRLEPWNEVDMRRALDIRNPAGHFLADPFPFEHDGTRHVFVEDYDFATKLGAICVYEVDEHGAKAVGTALAEPFHLSFPFLFRHEEQLYMLPETSQARQIRVYRCEAFPLRWTLHKVLRDDVSAVDTMLFERGGRWWMLTNIDTAGGDEFGSELHVFHADSPLATEWVPHPGNPVVTDSRCARNGGLLRDGERIFRVAQRQGFDQYGKSSAIFEIVELGPTSYAERLVRQISPSFRHGALGTHHLASTGGITTFDYVHR